MTPPSMPSGYKPQDPASLKSYLAGLPEVRRRLGSNIGDWTIDEVGDGNLNLVFKVHGPSGGVAVKQALPYVRLVGEGWPLPLNRAHYEHQALRRHWQWAPKLVPEIYHYDEGMALIVMELLEPHIIMRRGMIQGCAYPHFVEHIATFAARTHFFSSSLHLSAAEKKDLVTSFAGNTALCKITEDLIFTEPYMLADRNRWTSPQLDPYAARLRADGDLKIAISRLKLRFIDDTQALIHGDLHTGSIMVTETETKVIDPEFAFVGPIGFDLGAIVANLLLSYFSQAGHEAAPGERDAYRDWILATIVSFWRAYRERFLTLWQEAGSGDGYPAALFETAEDKARLALEQAAYLDRLFTDLIGFAAAKMIRRILGLAHNIDLEWIKDPDLRAACEARALTLARDMMVNAAQITDPADICVAARELSRWQPVLG